MIISDICFLTGFDVDEKNDLVFKDAVMPHTTKLLCSRTFKKENPMIIVHVERLGS